MKNMLRRTRCRQVHADHSLQLDDPRGDLDQAQAQRVELRHAPHRALRHRNAKAPHDPVGARVQEQPQLVGACLGARRAVGRQVGLPGFDVVLGLTALAVDILVEPTGVALLQIGDDEARVRTLRADLDAGDDALDAAPTRGPVVKLLEPARLAVLRRGLVERLRRRFQAFDMPAQRRGRRGAEDIVEPVGATEVENLGSAMWLSPRTRTSVLGQLARMARCKRRRKALISFPPGREPFPINLQTSASRDAGHPPAKEKRVREVIIPQRQHVQIAFFPHAGFAG